MFTTQFPEETRNELLRRPGRDGGLPFHPGLPPLSVQRVMSNALPVASLASRAAHDPEFVSVLAHAVHTEDAASMERAFAEVGVHATVEFQPESSTPAAGTTAEALKASTVVHIIIEGLEIVYKALKKIDN